MNYAALAACPSVLVVPDPWLEPVRINNRCVWDDYNIDSPVRKFVLMLTVGIVCGLWSVDDEELGDDNVSAEAMFRQC